VLITPYRPRLQSARLLRDALRAIGFDVGIRRPHKYRKSASRLIINWGNSSAGHGAGPWGLPAYVLNAPGAIATACDKRATLAEFDRAGVSCPEWTTDPERARELWGADRTLSRLQLRGRGGAGIVPGIVPGARLFVRHYRKRAEYRVHVFGGEVAIVQRKRRKNGTPPGAIAWTHGAGYVFSTRLGDPPADLETVAIGAVAALGLDFGAVDIIDHGGRAIVLETNTAPGLSPSTASAYASALIPLFSSNY
jgi:hypothetical protein